MPSPTPDETIRAKDSFEDLLAISDASVCNVEGREAAEDVVKSSKGQPEEAVVLAHTLYSELGLPRPEQVDLSFWYGIFKNMATDTLRPSLRLPTSHSLPVFDTVYQSIHELDQFTFSNRATLSRYIYEYFQKRENITTLRAEQRQLEEAMGEVAGQMETLSQDIDSLRQLLAQIKAVPAAFQNVVNIDEKARMSAFTTVNLNLKRLESTLACQKTDFAKGAVLEEQMAKDLQGLNESIKSRLVEEAELASGWATINEAMWARNWAV